MKQLLCWFCLLLVAPFYLNAGGIEVKRERVFTGSGLYGYMNGGAELFLEYGVRELTTRDLVYLGETYTLDIYEMPTPEDAFGIYSVHTFKCNEADRNGAIDCLSTYQLQCVVANCYVSLVFTSGSERARVNADEVLRYYTAGLGDGKVAFPESLPALQPLSGALKFLRGQIALSGAQLSLAKLLKDNSFTGVWLFPAPNEGEKQAILCFADSGEKEAFRGKVDASDVLEEGDLWIAILSRDGESPEESDSLFGF